MKRYLLTCLMAVSLCLTAIADNVVSITSGQGHPDDEVEIAVKLTNSDEITAIEILIPLGDNLDYVDGSVTLNSERSNGHQITAAEQDGKLNVCIYSIALASLKGAEGEICSFKVKLGKEPAKYQLVPEVVISDKSGNAISSNANSGAVTILTPKIEVITPVIDYGEVPIRSSYTQSLTIRNSGNEPLEITGFTFDNSDLSASPKNVTIEPGNTQNIVLTYSPLKRGTISSIVNISSNAINSRAGKATVKAQPFSVNELHVQHAEGISDQEVIVVLKMNNMEPIAAAQCSFQLPEELVYVEGSAKAGSMCNGTNHKVSASVQGRTLTLLLYSSSNGTIPEGDGELMTFKVRLDGQSGWYYINPGDVTLSNVGMENMVSATSGEYVVIQSPSFSGNNSLSFGESPITEKVTATYSIYNSSSVDLVISNVAFLAEGYAVEGDLPITIGPRQRQNLTVSYTPAKEGEHRTTMQIYTNDPVNRMYSVALEGKIYEPNRITVNGDNTLTGYQFTFGLDNYTDIVAVQMNVSWLSGMTTSTAKLTATDRLKNHSYLVTDVGNGTYQILIYSMANNPISGNSGSLFTLDYSAADGVTYRDTELRVTDIVLSDANGSNYVSDGVVNALAAFNNFSLKFEVENNVISEQFVKAGTEIVAPKTEDIVGYTFTWTNFPATMPNNDLVVIGSYTPNNYSVVYMVDGEEFYSETVAYGTELTAIDAPVREGYTFSGWSEIPTTMPASNVTVEGTFTVNSYKLTYVVDGEEHHSEQVEYGTELAAIDAPVKEGNTFSGWVGLPKTMPAKDVVVTGSFSTNSYTLTYKVDGEEFHTELIEYGKELTALETPTKEGYTFSGWSEVPATMPAENVTIEGTFTVNSYKLTYVVDGEEHHSELVEYGSALTSLAEPTKEGSTFSGWVGLPKTMPAKDVVVTGSFSTNSYTITYILDGEEYHSELVEFGKELTVLAEPTKEGYTFSGWSKIPATMPSENVTVEGSFTINSYKLTYMVDGEEYHSELVEFGKELTELAEPTKEGYTFSGWSEIPATMPAEDVVITGNFVVDSIEHLYDNSFVNVYSINGKLLLQKVTIDDAKRILERGLYIINGSKILIQ